MNDLRRGIGIALYVIAAFIGLSFAINWNTQIALGAKGFFTLFLLVSMAAMFAFFGYQVRRGTTKPLSRIDRIRAQAEQWARTVEDGGFPKVDTGLMVVPRGEFAILCERSRLYELKRLSSRGYAGTRVKIGGVPLYLGGSQQFSKQALQESSGGTLMLTNTHLQFSGDQALETIELNRVVSVEPGLDFVRIAARGRSLPVTFAVGNPMIWHMAILTAVRGLTEPRLPKGYRLLA